MRQSKVQELSIEIINKMLEPYKIDYQYIKDHSSINGIPWYDYYTWTESQQSEFKEWAVSRVKKEFKVTDERARKEVGWMLLSYGLRCIPDELTKDQADEENN